MASHAPRALRSTAGWPHLTLLLLMPLLLIQVKALIQAIKAASERPVDKIDRQQLRKQAHQLADYCKDGGCRCGCWGVLAAAAAGRASLGHGLHQVRLPPPAYHGMARQAACSMHRGSSRVLGLSLLVSASHLRTDSPVLTHWLCVQMHWWNGSCKLEQLMLWCRSSASQKRQIL